MRVVAVTLAALVFAPAFAGAASPVRLASGLRGIVTRGPTKPVCMETEPCEAPAVGVVLRFTRAGGRVAARVKTGAAGSYTVRLRPGTYTVATPQRAVGTGLTPRVVRVPRGRLARVDFYLDTGIQ